MVRIQQQGEGVTLAVKVHPRARRNRISGVVGETLKVELTTPPVEGRANEACVSFFAQLLQVPRSSVTITAGAHSRNKVLRIAGLSAAAVEKAVSEALGEKSH